MVQVGLGLHPVPKINQCTGASCSHDAYIGTQRFVDGGGGVNF